MPAFGVTIFINEGVHGEIRAAIGVVVKGKEFKNLVGLWSHVIAVVNRCQLGPCVIGDGLS